MFSIWFSEHWPLNCDEDLSRTIQKCKDFVGESIPVIDPQKKLLGVVTEGDLFQIYLKVSKEEKEIENKD